ncbi:MAG: hypothetical protein KAZ87_10595, partial [Spirochaetes bacterium]|nr:hypothetical protein [Spirochaetota bacterium]
DSIYDERETHLKRTYYLNSNFDLELGNIPTERYQKFADEMTSLFIPAIDADDYVLVNIIPFPSYCKYFEEIGIKCASIAGHSAPQSEGRAWGMNSNARKILEAHNCVCDFPEESIVRKINSRKYSNDICRISGYPHGECADTYEELLDLAAKSSIPFVAKSEFGSSASGFIHVKKNDDLKKLSKASNYYSFGISFLIESWRERIEDFSAGFYISIEGCIQNFNIRKLFSSSRGQFEALISGVPVEEGVVSALTQASQIIAKNLISEGYTGHVSFDAYTFRDGDKIYLNPVSEINARMTMADIARLMAAKTSSKISSIKFVKGKHLEKFKCESDIVSYFGDDSYSAGRGKGIILMSPLYYEKNGAKYLTERALFCVLSDNESETLHCLKKIASLEWHGL